MAASASKLLTPKTLAEAIVEIPPVGSPNEWSEQQIILHLENHWGNNKNINTLNADMDAAIHAAICAGQPTALRWCIDHKADVFLLGGDSKATREKRYSPLDLAVQHKNLQKFNETQAKDNKEEKKHLANIECLRLLLKQTPIESSLFSKLTQSDIDDHYKQAFLKAIDSGNLLYVDYFLNHLHVKKNAKNIIKKFINDDIRIKILSVEADHEEMSKIIWSRLGEELFTTANFYPLHSAACNGALYSVSKLLESKHEDLKPNKITKRGWSPLTWALAFYIGDGGCIPHKNQKDKTKAIIQLLLDHGSEWRPEDINLVINVDDADALAMLKEEYHFDEKNEFSIEKEKLIDFAFKKNKKNCIKYYLQLGQIESKFRSIDIDRAPICLYYAVSYCDMDIIKSILSQSHYYLLRKNLIESLIDQVRQDRKDGLKDSLILFLETILSYRDKDINKIYQLAFAKKMQDLKKQFQSDYHFLIDLFAKIESRQEAEAKKLEAESVNIESYNAILQSIVDKKKEGQPNLNILPSAPHLDVALAPPAASASNEKVASSKDEKSLSASANVLAKQSFVVQNGNLSRVKNRLQTLQNDLDDTFYHPEIDFYINREDVRQKRRDEICAELGMLIARWPQFKKEIDQIFTDYSEKLKSSNYCDVA